MTPLDDDRAPPSSDTTGSGGAPAYGRDGTVGVAGASAKPTPKHLQAIYNVPVKVSAVLGRASMPVSQLLKLGRGAVIELDRRVGDAVDIYVNDRLVARGEVVVVDQHLGITMTEIVASE